MTISIVWLRRNLRLHDNKPLSIAAHRQEKILPIFIFDTHLLKRFSDPYDRRLSFLANILFNLNKKLQSFGGEIIILHGNSIEIVPTLVEALSVQNIYADEDFEPDNIKRDQSLAEKIHGLANIELFCDHLLFRSQEIVNKQGEPYKIFTSYMQEFRRRITKESLSEYECDLSSRLATIDKEKLKASGLKIVEMDESPEGILKQIGYNHIEDKLWLADVGYKTLLYFINNKVETYKDNRDHLDVEGTSRLSPYLRFGLISVRECYRLALDVSDIWVNELIWREFYAAILYHFPHTQSQEFIEKYRWRIPWRNNRELWHKFIRGQTGYPVIDAAVRQLLQEGWMHNRARMIVASFLTKNLLTDWRLGEKFFARYLMDYELASNIGGWQWSASCGTDPHPYFRVFNPFLQGQKFDPQGEYIKKYVPKLKAVEPKLLHAPEPIHGYYEHIVDYQESRIKAIEVFKNMG